MYNSSVGQHALLIHVSFSAVSVARVLALLIHLKLMLLLGFSLVVLSQRVCHIQIRIYFANLYVSLLDLITEGVEVSLDVFGSFVKSGFLHQGNCSIIVTKDFHWTRCTRY